MMYERRLVTILSKGFPKNGKAVRLVCNVQEDVVLLFFGGIGMDLNNFALR